MGPQGERRAGGLAGLVGAPGGVELVRVDHVGFDLGAGGGDRLPVGLGDEAEGVGVAAGVGGDVERQHLDRVAALL